MTKVMVLGGSGMLGHMVAGYLSQQPGFVVSSTARSIPAFDWIRDNQPLVRPIMYNALSNSGLELDGYEYMINCIGMIKPTIKSFDDEIDALKINAEFPRKLARYAERRKVQVIHITTDCVYSGDVMPLPFGGFDGYDENDRPTVTDVYGLSKYLGEINHPLFTNLRSSIIGPEAFHHYSLLEWFLSQPEDAQVHGYENHHWNGITTLAYAKIVHGIMSRQIDLAPDTKHIVPADSVNKYQLLQLFGYYFRPDITIIPSQASESVDRRLATIRPHINTMLWKMAGYADVPTIADLIEELKVYVDNNQQVE